MAHVLVVDDERGIRTTLRAFLQASGHEVLLAESVAEGKAVLSSGRVDVIVLDVLLPRESGLQLLRHVHDVAPEIETIMMTGEPTIEVTVQAMRLGAFDFLAKPVLGDRVCELVAQAAERKAAREATSQALRESEARFRRLGENSQDMIWRADLLGRLEYVNQAVTRLLQRAPEEILGAPVERYLRPESASSFLDWVEAARRGDSRGDHFSAEVDFLHATGAAVPCELHAAAVRSETGSLVALEGITRDITERRRAEARLRESEQRFRTVVESSPMGIVMSRLGPEGQVTLDGANSAVERILGTGCLTVPEAEIATVLPGGLASELEERLRAAADTGLRWEGELSWVDAESGRRIVAVHVFQTSPGKAAMHLLDQTERRRAEQARSRLEEQLRQSQRIESIGLLAGGIAHDMNNFLGAIMASASVLETEVTPESHSARDVSSILEACRKGRALTRNLLRFARRGRLVRERFLVSESVVATKEILERTIPKNVRVGAELAADLWTVEGDRSLISQALMNVCLNAVAAMPHGGELTLSARNFVLDERSSEDWAEVGRGRYVLVEVSDTGEGMSQDTLDRVFDPFFTSKQEGEGAGLGLSVVFGTIRSHGGAAKLTSELGIGTLASLLLPAPAERAPRAVRASVAGDTVLLVDDEPLMRYAGRRLLEKLGYRVLEASDGAEAVELYRQAGGVISLVILDVLMPEMDGLETFRRLRALDPAVKVLVASGYSTNEGVLTMLREGARGFLEKPYELGQFTEKLAEVTG